MIVRIGKRNFKLFAMDVESHNDEESIKKRETSIWLGSFIDENSKVDDPESYFYTIDEFLNKCELLSRPKRNKKGSRLCKNLAIYIFNLSFEWSFILPVLLERGFTWAEDIKNGFNCFNSTSTRSCSSVWEVNLKFGQNNGIVKLRDLSKIFSGSLRSVAKSFGLATQKGEIDYRLNRLHNHIITDQEREYCFKDTRIVIEILQELYNRGDKDFFKSISAASYSMLKLVKTGYGMKFRPYSEFRKEYPELSFEENEFLRKGVEGGITYAPENYQFKIINQKILHIDMHQAHPSSAYLNNFPYGTGTYFKGRPLINKICACRIKITYDYVKLHSIIKLIGLPFITDYELTVWDFEIPLMKQCYGNLRIEYIDGYAYNMKVLKWRRYYRENYNKRRIAKELHDDFNIVYYKLLNNSSYGKLLEKPHNEYIINRIGEDDIITSEVVPKAEEDVRANAKYTYIPVGSAIPAYTRVRLVSTALKFGYENVVYFDTDSIFVLYNEKTKKVWDTEVNQKDELGGWGLEEIIDRAQFTAPKRYKTVTDGKTTVKAGGINFGRYLFDMKKDHLDFDEIDLIDSEWDVQRAFRCKGGTIIDVQRKQIQIQKKYLPIYQKNMS